MTPQTPKQLSKGLHERKILIGTFDGLDRDEQQNKDQSMHLVLPPHVYLGNHEKGLSAQYTNKNVCTLTFTLLSIFQEIPNIGISCGTQICGQYPMDVLQLPLSISWESPIGTYVAGQSKG